jgi:hypothetical protein
VHEGREVDQLDDRRDDRALGRVGPGAAGRVTRARREQHERAMEAMK